jgi:protein-disulfide isomerase
MAASDQGKFWEFHDKLFANQQKMQRPSFLQWAGEVGIDVKRFERTLDTSIGKSAVDADVAEAKALGITGTPAFFVNGRYLSGAKPFDEFARVIDAELTKLGVAAPPAAAAAKPGI